MAKFGSKSDRYVQSLVDFINDTKPFHSKLTSVVEEYQFHENMQVKIDERMFLRAKLKSTWLYNYFSGGNSQFRTLPLGEVVRPVVSATRFLVGEHELTDFGSLPLSFSKKTFDNEAVVGVHVEKTSGEVLPLIESHDYFVSHGAFQFQIKKTTDANGEFAPEWVSTNVKLTSTGLVPVTAVAEALALVQEIEQKVAAAGGQPDVQRIIDQLKTTLQPVSGSGELPRTFEPLLIALSTFGVAGIDPQDYRVRLRGLVSRQQSGRATYPPVTKNTSIRITDVDFVPTSEAEEWVLTAESSTTSKWQVTGSKSGLLGFITATPAGTRFTAAGKISFTVTAETDTSGAGVATVVLPTRGDELTLTPVQQVVIHPGAPLEQWNLIKVNPLAYSRPALASPRFGKIQDASGTVGLVSVLDPALPPGKITLTARTGGAIFDLVNSADLGHQGVAQVGVPFNDGRVAFTIVAGTHAFEAGDKFTFWIENEPARAENIDLGFGYDLDPFDNDHIVDDLNRTLDFFYDGRFDNFDPDLLNVHVSESSVSGQQWRVRALPNSNTPISTLKKDGSGPDNRVDLEDATTGVFSDPALNAAPVYNLPGASSPALRLFYADKFAVEFLNPGATSWAFVRLMSAGESFTSADSSVSFTIPAQLSKPYIAVSAYDGEGAPRVEGGDTFSFSVYNPAARLKYRPVSLTAPYLPRLEPRADSFFEAPPATWSVRFLDSDRFLVEGASNGGVIHSEEATLSTGGLIVNEGRSYKANDIHFTIYPGIGLAAGDSFTFTTFEQKPTYLVHGSVTGWTAPAEVGKFYSNGKISFKVEKPTWSLHTEQRIQIPNPENVSFNLTRLRDDAPSLEYELTQTTTGYMVSRSDAGPIGFCDPVEGFRDEYVDFTLTNNQSKFFLNIKGSDLPLFTGQDAVILNGQQGSLVVGDAEPGDAVVIQKSRNTDLSISLTSTSANAAPLKPIFIDQHAFTQIETSPETKVLSGWLPTFSVHYDSATSLARFSDSATRHVYFSSATGEKIGTAYLAGGVTPVFEWDPGFFETYLPLNAEANLVVRGTGWNEKVNARITEALRFLVTGGLDESFMFKDSLAFQVDDDVFEVKIELKPAENFTAAVDDGPFAGFLAGYDNQPFDLEEAPSTGEYDQGEPKLVAGFGLPAVGLAVAAEADSTATASTSVTDVVIMFIEDGGNPLEKFSLGVGELDAPEAFEVIVSGVKPGAQTIRIEAPKKFTTIEVLFDSPLVTTPTFEIDQAGLREPAIVEQISNRRFRLLTRATQAGSIVIS